MILIVNVLNWHNLFLCFSSNSENKKADNLSRLSADVLSDYFRAHNIPFLGETFFKSGLNIHLFFFLQRY